MGSKAAGHTPVCLPAPRCAGMACSVQTSSRAGPAAAGAAAGCRLVLTAIGRDGNASADHQHVPQAGCSGIHPGTREHTQNVSLWPRSGRSKVGRAWREWRYGLPGCISWRRPQAGGLAGRQAGRVLTESKVLGAKAAADDEDGDRHGCLQQRTSSMQGGGVLVFWPASRPAKGGMAPCSWPAGSSASSSAAAECACTADPP